MAALFAVQAKNAAVCMQPGARVVVRCVLVLCTSGC